MTAASANPGVPAGGTTPAATAAPSGVRALRACDMAAAVRAELVLRGLAPADSATEPPAPLAEWNLENVAETDLLAAYAACTGLPVLDEERYETLARFPEITFDYLAHRTALPLEWDRERVLVAVAAPYDLGGLARQFRTLFGLTAAFTLGRRSWIERQLTAIYDRAQEAGGLPDGADASAEALKDLAREAPVVRTVNDIFSRAVEMGASDIHVEPGETEMAVRYRIDGLLQTVQTLPAASYAAISSRLKLLANLNIAERRLPQDGRMDLHVGRIQLDIRASTVPTLHGESVVMRLLQKNTDIFRLESLGMDEATRREFERISQMPHGMLLVVGPTGSGKTTTLYCVMRLLNSETMKIITLEDPVEYQLPGVSQIQVKPQIGLTFANGLRSIVRQDPDIILVGEIRDRETAEIAIHAALTGHLVLSTLHTNDAPGAVSRLLDMGVEGFLISSSLLGVLSQRLVRKVCGDCKGTGEGTDAETGKPRRCRACAGSGFHGRIGIFELMAVDEEIRQAINNRRDAAEIAAIARRHGMRPLREDGEAKVRAGLTTAAEVARVCQLDAVVAEQPG